MARNIDKQNVVSLGRKSLRKVAQIRNNRRARSGSASTKTYPPVRLLSETAGFDAVIIVNEKLINEASAALFYGNFLTINGELDFAKGSMALPKDVLDKVPSTLVDFLRVRYRCKMLYEPMIDFKSDKSMTMTAMLRLYVWMMDGLELKFDASLSVSAPLNFSMNCDDQISIPFTQCKVDELKIKLKGSETDVANINVVSLFSKAIDGYLKNTERALTIKLPTFSTYLPYTNQVPQNKFNINIAAVSVIDNQQLAIAFNFLGHTGGNKDALRAFAPNSNLAVALSKKAMLDTYDFFWNHTNWNKYVNFTTTFEIDLVSKIVDYGFDLQSFVTNLATSLATLGLINVDYDFEKVEFLFNFRTNLIEQPKIDLINGNLVEVSNIGNGIALSLAADVHYVRKIEVDTSLGIPDKCTPWNDDIVISKKHCTHRLFNLCIGMRNSSIKNCSGELYLDEEDQAIKVDINKVTFGKVMTDDCSLRSLGEDVVRWLMNKLTGFVVPKIPPIVVSPSIVKLDIPNINSPLTIEGRKLDISSDRVVAGAYLSFDKMKTITEPMPKYVVNTNTKEVHRIGCDCIMDTYETHQRGYYSLQKALSAGFDGCKKCLPAYHKR